MNPFLEADRRAAVRAATLAVVLASTREEAIAARAALAAKDLLAALRPSHAPDEARCEAQSEAPGGSADDTAGGSGDQGNARGSAGGGVRVDLVLKANKLAASLLTSRSTLDQSKGGVLGDPRFLVFEFIYGIVLRQAQVRLAKLLQLDLGVPSTVTAPCTSLFN